MVQFDSSKKVRFDRCFYRKVYTIEIQRTRKKKLKKK